MERRVTLFAVFDDLGVPILQKLPAFCRDSGMDETNPDDHLVIFDVESLYTNVPVNKSLMNRTNLSAETIIALLELYMKNPKNIHTMESEKNGNIPFLDVEIKKKRKQIYDKSTENRLTQDVT